jgi:predicted esterase
MSRRTAHRPWCAKVVVCGLVASAFVGTGWLTLRSASAEPTAHAESRSKPRSATRAPAKPAELRVPATPVVLTEADGKHSVVVHPPEHRGAPQPVTVMLHGMCDEPQNECPWFDAPATPGGWLLCPRANRSCQGGGSTWSSDAGRTVESSIGLVEHDYPGTVDAAHGRTVVGFSLGGSRALSLAEAGNGKYRYVIVIAAKVYPSADKLRQAGVERIVLAAGDYDMTHAHLVAQAKRLARQGFPVAFMSMGKVGHTFPRDLPERMTRAFAWLHGDDSGFVPARAGEIAFVPEAKSPSNG